MHLRYTETGFLVILQEDDPHEIVDAMLETGYDKEFCVSLDFAPEFIAKLMEAGFLVMSAKFGGQEHGEDETPDPAKESFYLPLPKLHLTRSALFFDNLHVKKSIKRYLNRYELRPDADFDIILNRCLEIHGDDWLTPPLVDAIRDIKRHNFHDVFPTSFALYRDGKLVAGEFGVRVGKVYTSYSGYYDESNSGTVQLVLTTRWLQEQGFAFFDLGMPLVYKNGLGAVDITPDEFVRLFRMAQGQSPNQGRQNDLCRRD